ncbi:MAG: CopG family transcriptional regulator [Deltaproteobacteria bacterium]|nr:CopG family transcriptional regulator [Deltaproteobacteria bacterium]
MKKTSQKPTNANEFDNYFEDNDIADLLQVRPSRINVDIPSAMLARLDAKAQQLGMTRQSLVKYWIAEHLKLVD